MKELFTDIEEFINLENKFKENNGVNLLENLVNNISEKEQMCKNSTFGFYT